MLLLEKVRFAFSVMSHGFDTPFQDVTISVETVQHMYPILKIGTVLLTVEAYAD
jgi:hypothetical protein